MERTSTFVNLGNRVTSATPIVDGLPADFAFSVSKKPMGYLGDNGDFNRVKGVSTVVREDTGRAYGAVSDKYNPVDNATALGSVQYVDGLRLERYGETAGGMQYLIGSLPNIKILGDDFTPFLIYRNSFDGKCPIQVCISPLRIVCQNQINWAFKHAKNTIAIRHTKTADAKIAEAHRILLETTDYLRNLTTMAELFASKAVSKEATIKIIRGLFPIKEDASDKQKEQIASEILAFETALHAEDNRNFKGTAWGIINAYTDYLTHKQPVRQTKTGEENRFVAVTFNPKAMDNLVALINAHTA